MIAGLLLNTELNTSKLEVPSVQMCGESPSMSPKVALTTFTLALLIAIDEPIAP
ncbi:hypothetical protein D3C80_2048960 [compost metagenome]